MDHGSVFKRCGCRDQESSRLLGTRCPKLRSPRHGSWYFSADLPPAAGKLRHFGYLSLPRRATGAPARQDDPLPGQ